MSQDLFQGDHPAQVMEDKIEKFEDLVGEGKRYADQDAVARAIAEKDRFIERLKFETQEAREAAKSRLNEDQFLDKLEQRLKSQSPQVAPQEDPAGQDAHTGIGPEEVVALIEQREATKKREANLGVVTQRLQATYGSDWKAQVATLAAQLGVGTQYLTNLAADSPQLFYNAIGMKEQPQLAPDRAPPRSALTAPLTSSSNVKDAAYWAQQRKEKGENWYYSIPVQQQIWKEQNTMGLEKFLERPSQII